MLLETKMFLVFLFALEVTKTESRVFCQDPHAVLWKPLGFSCPITCKTILSAVEKLKEKDNEKLSSLISAKPLSLPIFRLRQRMLKSESARLRDKYNKTYIAFTSIIHTEEFFSDFHLALDDLTKSLNLTCYVTSNKTKLLRDVLNDCTINKSSGYLMNTFKNFLNKHRDHRNRFDTAMTLIILRHLLSNSNFRYGNIEAILVLLRAALRPEEMGITKGKEDQIVLTPKHCLSLFVPGCFCSKGYVENRGLCVRPNFCSTEQLTLAYLHRIILK